MSAVLRAYARISEKGLTRALGVAGKPLLTVSTWPDLGAGPVDDTGLPSLKARFFTTKSWPRYGRMDLLCKLGVGAAELCMGLDFSCLPRDEVALVGASMLGSLEVDAEYHDTLLKGGPAAASPALFVYTLPSMFLGEIAIGLGLRGRTSLISQGRLSAVAALAAAVRLIEKGRATSVLAVAAEAVGPAVRQLEVGPTGSSGACAWLLTSDGEGIARLGGVRFGSSEISAGVREAGAGSYGLTYVDALQEALLGGRSKTLCCGEGSDTITLDLSQ